MIQVQALSSLSSSNCFKFMFNSTIQKIVILFQFRCLRHWLEEALLLEGRDLFIQGYLLTQFSEM